MGEKIKLDDKEYDLESITDSGKATFRSAQFATQRITELNDMMVVLRRAKNSYIESLKKEMLSSKAGLLFNDE